MEVEFSFTVYESKRQMFQRIMNIRTKPINLIKRQSILLKFNITKRQNYSKFTVISIRLLNPNSGYVKLEAHVQKNSRVM